MKVTIVCDEKDFRMALQAAADFIDDNPKPNSMDYCRQNGKLIIGKRTSAGNINVTVENDNE